MKNQRSGPRWGRNILQAFKRADEDRATLVAAGVTYFVLLAIFPALSAAVSIYGLVVEQATIQQHVSALASFLPEGGASLIEKQLNHLLEQGKPNLGIALIVSLLVAIWSASAAARALLQAMNVAYGEEESRGFIVVTALSVLLTLAGIVGSSLMVGAVLAVPMVLSLVGMESEATFLAQAGAYLVALAGLGLAVAMLYRFGPSRKHATWRCVVPGTILAVMTMGVSSGVFSWYTANLAHYEQTYGSLGGLIGFLTWIWICMLAVILGAELNAEAEKGERRSAPAPLGDATELA